MIQDIEALDTQFLEKRGAEMLSKEFTRPTLEIARKYKNMIIALLQDEPIMSLKRKYSMFQKNSYIYFMFKLLLDNREITCTEEEEKILRKALMIKPCKSWSGITSITIFTSPYPKGDDGQIQKFSCAYNCSFCPNQPGQPRSYILNEPGVLRANKNKYDCVSQMYDRLQALYNIGHINLAKLEVLVLGGTFASYPISYRIEFCRDLFYAANTFWDDNKRERLSLEQEQNINRTAMTRVIGLTIETRGDSINSTELKLLKRLGCTRIQMGIQHIDDDILNINNRKCPHYKTVNAIEMLKRNCWKIDGHFMPNLPGSSPEKDYDMLVNQFVGVKSMKQGCYDLINPDIQVDQVKIYPCAVTAYTEIEKWYISGQYKPYSNEKLIDIIIDFKNRVFPWIRINRVVRDFFAEAIHENAGRDLLNLRADLSKKQIKCHCIRCREIKDHLFEKWNIDVLQYNASNGTEYFIQAVTECKQHLFGFVRLRLDDGFNKVFVELNNAALIREVHVYSQTTFVGEKSNTSVQHKGIGSLLMKKAEEIALKNNYYKIAVISGIGAQTFYEKLGYERSDSDFMIKTFYKNWF